MTDDRKDLVAAGNSDQPAGHIGTTATALAPFSSVEGFELAQRMSTALATADIVPKQFQNNVGNLLIAMDLANRTKSNIMAVMQNIYIVHGKPSWSSSWTIAAINQSKRFSEPLHFEFQGEEHTDDWGCRACTVSKSGKEIKGPLVTLGMAKSEGWYGRSGSKWQTMPELMLRYRAAAFFGRTEVPDLLFGMQTEEELRDINPPYDFQPAASEPIADAEIISTVQAVDVEQETKQPDEVITGVIPKGESTVATTSAGPGPDPADNEWPRWHERTESWIDSFGVMYDPGAHASYSGDKPTVNSDGGFKVGRGKAHKATILKSQALERKSEEMRKQPITQAAEPEPEAATAHIERGDYGAVTEGPPPQEEPPIQTEAPGGEETVIRQSFMNPQEEPQKEDPPEDSIDGFQKKVDAAAGMPELLDLQASLTGKAYLDNGIQALGVRYRELIASGAITAD